MREAWKEKDDSIGSRGHNKKRRWKLKKAKKIERKRDKAIINNCTN